jgi:hypothetical protein
VNTRHISRQTRSWLPPENESGYPDASGFTRFMRSRISFCTQGRGCRSPFFHAYTMRSGHSSVSAIFDADQGAMAFVNSMNRAKRKVHKVQDCSCAVLHNVQSHGMNLDTILANAEKGIRLMQQAQPGRADMETRKTLKQQACAYLDTFAAVGAWPKAYRDAVRAIEDKILNGYS